MKFNEGDKFKLGDATGTVDMRFQPTIYRRGSYHVQFDGNLASFGDAPRFNNFDAEWFDSVAEKVEF
jgi:hypothetical protein